MANDEKKMAKRMQQYFEAKRFHILKSMDGNVDEKIDDDLARQLVLYHQAAQAAEAAGESIPVKSAYETGRGIGIDK